MPRERQGRRRVSTGLARDGQAERPHEPEQPSASRCRIRSVPQGILRPRGERRPRWRCLWARRIAAALRGCQARVHPTGPGVRRGLPTGVEGADGSLDIKADQRVHYCVYSVSSHLGGIGVQVDWQTSGQHRYGDDAFAHLGVARVRLSSREHCVTHQLDTTRLGRGIQSIFNVLTVVGSLSGVHRWDLPLILPRYPGAKQQPHEGDHWRYRQDSRGSSTVPNGKHAIQDFFHDVIPLAGQTAQPHREPYHLVPAQYRLQLPP